MNEKWLSTVEACQVLDISASTLRRRVIKGELQSRVENGKRVILVQTDDPMIANLNEQLKLKDERIVQLENQVNRLQDMLVEKDKLFEESRMRQDSIIMQQSKQIEYLTLPWWKKFSKKKSLPEKKD